MLCLEADVDVEEDEGVGKPAQAEVEKLTGVVVDMERVKAEVDEACYPMVCTHVSVIYYMCS